MTQQQWLEQLLNQGFHRMGQLEIIRATPSHRSLWERIKSIFGISSQAHSEQCPFWICHQDDRDVVISSDGNPAHFTITQDPYQAREISTYSGDQQYRFTKGQTNLKRGWLMKVEGTKSLLAALDGFYPACFGLWVAQQRGTLDVQHLRDKLNRQTGMYRFAKSISDEGAQALVQQVCGPAHQCAKKILWKLDERTPLDDSEASRFNGISSGLPEPQAIPLLCREACNHFVAECRKASKREFEAKAAETA